MAFTSSQVEAVQIDHGLVFIDYGLAGQRQLGPTRGGATFTVTKNIRDIEFDGRKGKTKGLQVVDEVNAVLTVPSLSTTMDDLALAMPWATYAASKLSAKSANIGVIASSAYLTNITMFAKTVGGDYKKITMYLPMNESDFNLAAAPKGEGLVSFEFNAHWNPLDDTADLFDIEDVETITTDTDAPTVATVPAAGATNVVVTSDLTATFSEAIREADINQVNFRLMKNDGTLVAGALTYVAATKVATFNPTDSLAAGSTYIWTIGGVRDVAGNTMVTVTKAFGTAS